MVCMMAGRILTMFGFCLISLDKRDVAAGLYFVVSSWLFAGAITCIKSGETNDYTCHLCYTEDG